MATIVITVDTEAKTVKSTIDGEVFEGTKRVFIDTFEFTNMSGDKETILDLELTADVSDDVPDGLRKLVRVVNASSKKAQSLLDRGLGVLSPDKTLVITDINNGLVDAAFNMMGKSTDK